MRLPTRHRAVLAGASALVLLAAPSSAQDSQGQQDIVVTGSREQPSKWREAETDHVIVLSDGSERELARIAHNLEKLHFLLSGLLGRLDQPDDTIKLRVTLVGDTAEFDAMDLRNLRAQPGPFAPAFAVQRYYDPREDGAILASTRYDQKATLTQGVSLASIGSLLAATMPPAPGGPSGGATAPNAASAAQTTNFGSIDPLSVTANSEEVNVSAEGRIYAGYAQHYLLTYFPAAYPRWYVDGFGEIFATLVAREDGVLEYGRPPSGVRQVLDHYATLPVSELLAGNSERRKDFAARWTPFHAWALTHMLFFSDERRPQLRAYLKAVADGLPPARAAQAFGDPKRLQREFVGYGQRKVPYDRITYPAERAGEPIVHQLTRGEAAFLKGRIELGSRVELPPAPSPGTDAKTAAQMERARRDAIATRDKWLGGLREDASRFPRNLEAQLLLAEAECRSGNDAECGAAADRALAVAPANADALTWKGIALTRQAVAGSAAERPARLKAARAAIARANRSDTEDPLPLIAYYRSFADAGEAAPDVAVAGLRKAVESVPAAPGPRLLLGEALVKRGELEAARKALRPVADGAYDSPERTRARILLGENAAG
jgi:tetratricopeptide (TPR) repeat protein